MEDDDIEVIEVVKIHKDTENNVVEQEDPEQGPLSQEHCESDEKSDGKDGETENGENEVLTQNDKTPGKFCPYFWHLAQTGRPVCAKFTIVLNFCAYFECLV